MDSLDLDCRNNVKGRLAKDKGTEKIDTFIKSETAVNDSENNKFTIWLLSR